MKNTVIIYGSQYGTTKRYAEHLSEISAKVEDGILTVTMPKTEPKQKVTKAIEVS